MRRGELVPCWRCGITLNAIPWDLDHTEDRTGYRGPACLPCNRAPRSSP